MPLREIFAPHLDRHVKMGRRRPPARSKLHFGDYVRADLPAPPTMADYSPAAASSLSRIYMNDSLGCCLPAGTRISMADGTTKPVQDIRPLDRVITAEGNESSVTAVMARYVNEPLVRVIAWGHSTLEMTANHPVLTRRGYVESGELRSDDWIVQPIRKAGAVEQFRTAHHLTTERLQAVVRSRGSMNAGSRAAQQQAIAIGMRTIPERISLTPGFGRIIGLFLAEGSTNQNTVCWTFSQDERETLVAELVTLLRDELGLSGVLSEAPGAIHVRVCGKVWRILFSSLCGKGAAGKVMDSDLTGGPAEFLQAIFDAWMDGDGYHRNATAKLQGLRAGTTVSHALAMDMFNVAQTLGLRPTMSRRVPKGAWATNGPNGERVSIKASPIWTIRVPDRLDTINPRGASEHRGVSWSKSEQKWVVYGRTPDHKSRRVGCFRSEQEAANAAVRDRLETGMFGNGRSDAGDGVVWRRVRRIDRQPFSGHVFNFEVAGDNSYVAEGVGVHNCVIADAAHAQGVVTGNSGNGLYVATDARIVADYGVIGGYVPGDESTDNGCDPETALAYYQSVGYGDGTKLACWMAADATNETLIKQGLFLFENASVSIELPEAWVSPMPQASGFVWDVAGPPVDTNGHEVCAVGYNATGIKIATWGLLGTITWAAAAKYLVVKAGGNVYFRPTQAMVSKATGKAPGGLNWPELASDAASMGGHLVVPPAPVPVPVPAPIPVPTPAPAPVAEDVVSFHPQTRVVTAPPGWTSRSGPFVTIDVLRGRVSLPPPWRFAGSPHMTAAASPIATELAAAEAMILLYIESPAALAVIGTLLKAAATRIEADTSSPIARKIEDVLFQLAEGYLAVPASAPPAD